MGLRGYGENRTGPSFVEDVLRIRVVGRTGLHLSIVDLPGLISTASEEQTESDLQTVQRMVDSYIEKPRTVILAIVQASNDVANQSIITKSKKYDRYGLRTVGILTKLDLINKGTEGRIAALAKNLDSTKLKLGFYVLKNPTPMEMQQKITAEQRSANELHFFQSSPWSEQKLDHHRVGINNLRTFLQQFLDKHIENELPKVRDEIRSLIQATQQALLQLPVERPSPAHLRMFLSDLAMRYHKLSVAALSGDYHSSDVDFFATKGNDIGPTRLRALVHRLNGEFADNMRNKGQTMKQTKAASTKRKLNPFADGGKFSKKSKSSAVHTFGASSFSLDGCAADGAVDEESSHSENRSETIGGESVPDVAANPAADAEQRQVTEAEMKAWVKETYAKTRGRELPGNFNHVLLTELFHQQSVRWARIAEDHLELVYENTAAFVKNAVAHLKVEDYVRMELYEGMTAKLHESKAAAEKELKQLCDDEQQQPITYNHYYTDNVQKSRVGHARSMLEDALKGAADTNGSLNTTPEALLAILEQRVIVDMDEQACSEALAGLNAYYKVALKSFVDNVCRQVIERHLLRSLPNIFSPHDVAGYADEELERIAGERSDVVAKRKELQEQLETLQAGLKDLRK